MSVFNCTVCKNNFPMESKHKKYFRCVPCVAHTQKLKRQENAKHKVDPMNNIQIDYIDQKFDMLVKIKKLSYGPNYSLTPKRKRWLLNEWCAGMNEKERDEINYNDAICMTV